MRYAKLSCIEFYSCYLQQCLSIDLFSYWTPSHGQKDPMNKVCPSARKFPWNWLAWSFHGVRGPYGIMIELNFLKKIFLLPKMEKMSQAQGSLNVYENLVIIFSSIWSIMEVYINCCMLGKILGNFGFSVMCQNVIGQSCMIFKSTISLEQNYEKV